MALPPVGRLQTRARHTDPKCMKESRHTWIDRDGGDKWINRDGRNTWMDRDGGNTWMDIDGGDT